MHKEERHQIKRDDLATLLHGTAEWLGGHNRLALAAGAAVVAVALLVGAGTTWWRGRQATTSRLLGNLIETANASVTATLEDLSQNRGGQPTFTSTEERDRKVIELADALEKRAGTAGAGGAATLYRAIAQAGLGQTDDAARGLDDLIRRDPNGLYGAMARLRLAGLREAQGKPTDALPLYQAIADAHGGLVPPEEGLLGMARCQEALGHADEAGKIYQRLVSDYPDSEYAGEAQTHLTNRT
ncbi:MAG TPA: tetratricopeptide repeat protein [Dongiaceae bacterium]|nr:tetratricopeptide repeat protein [Dongiaceae bacterium]